MPKQAAAKEICLQIQQLKELPPLPTGAHQLLEALGDDDVDVTMLARLIEANPPVAARVVGLARSAYFSRAVPVRSVADAVVRVLGLTLVKNLVISVAVSGAFRPERCRGFDVERYWANALLTASLARLLARGVAVDERPQMDTAYLCGLLHNIGLVVLTHVAPEPMERVFESELIAGAQLAEVERGILGTDHCKAGALLARRWKLPEEVQIVAEFHLEPDYRGTHWPVCRLVGACSDWAQAWLDSEETPGFDADAAEVLGIAEPVLDAGLEACATHAAEIVELGKLFAKKR